MAKLEISLKCTVGDGTCAEAHSTITFKEDEPAIDQYWAILRGMGGASEEEERKGRRRNHPKKSR